MAHLMSPPKVDGARLKELRLRAGLSQEALAKRARMSYRTVFRLEAGETKTARELTIMALANALDVEQSELLED
jgi:transcriptional regulator with XRE-family HTH domain